MEVLSLILQKTCNNNNAFKYHQRCSEQKIINVCFADDLIIFVNADIQSVNLVTDALNVFQQASGLTPSTAKSQVFYCNVPSDIKRSIRDILPFDEGQLPIRYLGVPLISKRLQYKDCKVLVERIIRKIEDWRNKFLSIAGRLQLITSVLSSMHTYWAAAFTLPAKLIADIEKSFRRFLWNANANGKTKAKVGWQLICKPKMEGGLGIKNLREVNNSLMTKHMWDIITNRNSLWVKWIKSYKLKGTSFWEISNRGSLSWSWRNILYLRDTIRPFVWYSVGNGNQTNIWSDRWCNLSPLRSIISTRNIYAAGFSLESTIGEVMEPDGRWSWPQAWYDLYPVLINVAEPNLTNQQDRVVWRDSTGAEKRFSSWEVWNSIRVHDQQVSWYYLVWFNHSIPRHSINLWLAIQNKLKTQDRLKPWEVGGATNLNLMCCPLCNYDRDSRNHLFFVCAYSLQVWSDISSMANMENIYPTWNNIIARLESLPTDNKMTTIVPRLVTAATTYFIWQERNGRLFSKTTRTPKALGETIINTVRLKLLSIRFNPQMLDRRLIEFWKIGEDIQIDPG